MQDVATVFVPRRLKLTVTLVSVQQAITQSVKELGYDQPTDDQLSHVKDWDPRDNDIHSRVPTHRTAISQIDEFHTENPAHT